MNTLGGVHTATQTRHSRPHSHNMCATSSQLEQVKMPQMNPKFRGASYQSCGSTFRCLCAKYVCPNVCVCVCVCACVCVCVQMCMWEHMCIHVCSVVCDVVV